MSESSDDRAGQEGMPWGWLCVVVLGTYVLAIGPLEWAGRHFGLNDSPLTPVIRAIYWPLIMVVEVTGTEVWIMHYIGWWVALG